MASEDESQAVPRDETGVECGWRHRFFTGEFVCPNPGDLELTDGRCVFHSHDEKKDLGLIREALMEMSRDGKYECLGWVLPVGGKLDFEDSEILHADFRAAYVQADILFKNTKVIGEVWFDEALISGELTVERTTFSGSFSLNDAIFEKNAYFGDSTFNSPVTFDRTMFSYVIFHNIHFNRPTVFYSTWFGEGLILRGEPCPRASFDRADLNNVVFRRCYLGWVWLNYAHNVAKCDFDHVEWQVANADTKNAGIRRGIAKILDSIMKPGHPSYMGYHEMIASTVGTRGSFKGAERIHREIRRSYEEHKHFQEAHRFAFRELEMRRLALGAKDAGRFGWLWANLFSFEAMYLQLSSYGQSWFKPIAILLLTIVLAPLLFAWAGISLATAPAPHQLLPSSPNLVQNYIDLLGFSIRSAALLSDPPGNPPLNFGAQLVQVFLRLFAPFMAFLFTLAVQRRFQR